MRRQLGLDLHDGAVIVAGGMFLASWPGVLNGNPFLDTRGLSWESRRPIYFGRQPEQGYSS